MKVDPRFLTAQGAEVFTGNELLVKGALETEGGVHYLGGYPGSPVAGFFDSLAAIKDLLNEKGIRAVLSNNEALAAAMINGSQTAATRAMIVMKSVGVHVAADGLALANMAGANPNGGAIVVYGDDPWSDSTQVACDSRFISKHLFIPTIEPSTPQEVKDFVDASFKLSRWSELYVGYVLTTNLADGGGTVQCRPNQYPSFNMRQRVEFDTSSIDLNKRVLLPPRTWWQEENFRERFGRAVAASRKLNLNQILYPQNRRTPIGFITSGMAHGYLQQALFELDLLGQYPILKYGLSYPIDAELLREFTQQCERVVVVEERRGFLEEQVNEVILKDRQGNKPSGKTEVWGKTFPGGLAAIPDTRGLHPSILISRLAPLIKLLSGSRTQIQVPEWVHQAKAEGPADSLERELQTIDSTAKAASELQALPPRIPSFCPGCPHRDSADVCLEIQKKFKDPHYMKQKYGRKPVDLMFHGDTGCYTMLMFDPNSSLMHDYSGMGLGGGTGAGIDPFITNKQAVFMGDSTFFHSGQIAISQAIKLGQDITFIILDNRTTGMTGHQPTPGVEYDIIGNPTAVQDIEEIVRGIAAAAEVPVLRVDPTQRRAYLELLEQTLLADGVKVIISDKECGITNLRRRRRQERALTKQYGYLPSSEHLNINQDVCRFCMACAEMTGCPGLKHVETDYGRKMDTDLTWCVGDGACERIGACSAFEYVTVKRKRPPRSRVPELGLDNIPEPQKRPVGDVWCCGLVGVGGMGIGLATSIVVRAGHNEGYEVIFLDKKGLAIRNGGVTSQVVYNIAHKPISPVIPYGKADLLLGIDVLEAARALDPRGRIRIASKEKTAAVINTDKVNTIRGLMGKDDFNPADLERLIEAHTRADDFLARDISRICEKYLGSKLYANIMMLGFAFQKGLIPVSMHSMAWAIKDTIRADFRKNLYAFNMGRKLVVQPDLFQGPPRRDDWRDLLEEKCRWTIRRYRGGAKLADALRELIAGVIDSMPGLDDKTRRDIVVRAYDCMRWGGIEYARRYARGLAEIYAKDSRLYNCAATQAVVYSLAGAMLIKDAIFLAELCTGPEKHARDREKYSVNRSNGDKIVYRHVWHMNLTLGRRHFPLHMTPREWMLKLLRNAKFLRKMLRLGSDQIRFLSNYEAQLAAFKYSDAEEYAQAVARMANLQCMGCLNPRCQEEGCPLCNCVPRWVDLYYQGNFKAASELLHAYNNFPEFTSRICPAPCQDKCKQGNNNFPVQIRDIERQIVDRAFQAGYVQPQPPLQRSGKKVAIIGSGPAGLAAAQQLARDGHEVTVFEKEQLVGGLLRYGIPPERLGKELLDRRLEQLKAEGVTFRTSAAVGVDMTGDQLREEFDAVLLTCGASKPRDLRVPGRHARGIYYALDFLQGTTGVSRGATTPAVDVKDKTVLVIGGGETGNDCIEAALTKGAKAVYQFEILPQPNHGAAKGLRGMVQILTAAAQGHGKGVHRRWCVATKEFTTSGDAVSGVKAAQVRWHLSTTGKAFTEIAGSEFAMPVDVAVLALGFEPVLDKPLALELGLTADAKGQVATENFATAVEGVFVAGDLSSGPSLVASAIASGRKAAAKVSAYLCRASETQVLSAIPQS